MVLLFWWWIHSLRQNSVLCGENLDAIAFVYIRHPRLYPASTLLVGVVVIDTCTLLSKRMSRHLLSILMLKLLNSLQQPSIRCWSESPARHLWFIHSAEMTKYMTFRVLWDCSPVSGRFVRFKHMLDPLPRANARYLVLNLDWLSLSRSLSHLDFVDNNLWPLWMRYLNQRLNYSKQRWTFRDCNTVSPTLVLFGRNDHVI